MKNYRLISNNRTDTERIIRELINSDGSLFVKKFEYGSTKITIFIAEDYYFRINSNLTLTVIAEETADRTIVEIISSGGKEGLFGFSYGAEKSAVKRVVNLLKENGFAEQ